MSLPACGFRYGLLTSSPTLASASRVDPSLLFCSPACRTLTINFPRPVLRLLTILAFASALLHAETITTRDDAVGRSLNHWATDETAAGFSALQYENRDGNHSLLPDLYKRLHRVVHLPEEIKEGMDKGFPNQLRKLPTIGNCSMSGTPDTIGSLPRTMFMHPLGHEILSAQYAANNLFIFPEHMDHDPGANGVGGWGDLFPVNHPGVLITQGSSGSDMAYVKALLAAAAALRPEVQEFLIRRGVLMPALQALLRQNSTLVETESDYFTGKAHPVVFDAATLDELKLVTAAQVMSLLSVPPVARLRLLTPPVARPGIDFFEVPQVAPQVLGSQPACVACVYRTSADFQDVRLSAEGSSDPGAKPLSFKWVLLQGDPAHVQIIPAEEGTQASVRIRWQPAMLATSGIRSHRVDIGLFASNGLKWSAPAIFCMAMLPNEQRFFDDQGRLTEICYEAGNPELGLPRKDDDPRWESFSKALKTQPLLALALEKAVVASPRAGAEQIINRIADQPDYFIKHQAKLLPLATKSSKATALTDLRAELKRLTDLGVLVESADGDFSIVHGADALTAADRYYLRQLHLTVLSQVLLPGLMERSPAPLFVDSRLSMTKAWRDVYHYGPDGKRTGWTRHSQGRTWRFNPTGQLLLEEKTVPVHYQANGNRLVFTPQLEPAK